MNEYCSLMYEFSRLDLIPMKLNSIIKILASIEYKEVTRKVTFIYILQPFLNENKKFTANFTHITFIHIYRETNPTTNTLSKEGTIMPYGSWYILEEDVASRHTLYYHTPFI
jgi:hypothetical protein